MMNILVVVPVPMPAPVINGGNLGTADPAILHKIILALSIALIVWAAVEIVIGYFKVRNVKEIFGMTSLWEKIKWETNVDLPLGVLGFIVLGYVVYGIYLLL